MDNRLILIEQNDNITGVNFVITSTKLYAPVVTLSSNDNIKFLEKIKQDFKRTISWNKYRSEITTQPKLFIFSFKNGNDDATRNPFGKSYIPLIEISQYRTNKKHMKNLSKCQEIMTIGEEIYWIICIINIITNSLVWIYQDRQIRIFLNKLILQ